MSYLRFEKALMTNLEEALPRELLRTNRSGAYSCSTIVDCNTRKYHGLLVVPVPELDDENHVLLSSLDVTVVQHGAEFNLGLHKYQGNNYSPKGHKYIREFDCDKVPTTLYRVGGVVLKKEVVFQHYTRTAEGDISVALAGSHKAQLLLVEDKETVARDGQHRPHKAHLLHVEVAHLLDVLACWRIIEVAVLVHN